MPIDRVMWYLDRVGIDHGVVFPFPSDIEASPESRQAANQFVLEEANGFGLHPFYGIWRDLALPPEPNGYCGVKWHMVGDIFDSPQFKETMGGIADWGIPVVYEDTFKNTLRFCSNADLDIIIPHLGILNGGWKTVLTAFADAENVYFDTSLAPMEAIKYAFDLLGPERIIYGSDLPYDRPEGALNNLLGVPMDRRARRLILRENISRLVSL